MLETQYDQHFILDLSGKPYVVCCRNRKKEEESCPKDCLFLGDVEGNDLFLIEAEALSDRPGEYPFLQEYTGISRPHQGIRELREAYLEAREMRRCAFCTNRSQMRYGQEMPRVPQKLVQEASKLVADEMKLQRVQLLGTDRTEELQHVWTQFFYEVKHGRIGVRDFEECMTDFLTETLKTYPECAGGKRKLRGDQRDYRPIRGGRNRPLRTEGAGICDRSAGADFKPV